MKLHRTVRYNPELFIVIPLVNVLFLLLAFITVSRTFILQPGISVALPVSSFSVGPQRNSHVISITGGAAPVIYFKDEKVALADLGQALARVGSAERSLIIRADRATPFDLVSQVMNAGLERGFSVVVAAAESQPR